MYENGVIMLYFIDASGQLDGMKPKVQQME